MKIPTQKVEHSCKCTELSPKRIEGIYYPCWYFGCQAFLVGLGYNNYVTAQMKTESFKFRFVFK